MGAGVVVKAVLTIGRARIERDEFVVAGGVVAAGVLRIDGYTIHVCLLLDVAGVLALEELAGLAVGVRITEVHDMVAHQLAKDLALACGFRAIVITRYGSS